MRRPAAFAAVIIICVLVQPSLTVYGGPVPTETPRYTGFTTEGTRAEIKLEDQFKALI